MKKNLIAVLIFAVSSSPILACTTMPPANTTKSSDRVVEVQNEAMIQVVSAVTSKRKGEPSQLPAPKPEKPAQLPEEEKPAQLPEEEKPAQLPEEEKPAQLPEEEKPAQLPEEEKPAQLPEEEKPAQLPEEEKPAQLPEEEKPAQLPEQGKPDQAPETEKPTQLPEQGKPSQKPCKKPVQLPEKGFVIDNFKIIQKALQKLGCTPEELEVMIKDGKKLIDVLEAKDIPVKKFRKALYKEYCSVIKEAVKEDKITHQEGKMLKAAIKEKVNSWMKNKE